MIRFEDLLDKVRSYSPDADLELLRRAYVFSALEHKGQVRHSGEPYLVHPLEVADILADMKLDAVCVAAGLLHDVVEDTLTTPETHPRALRRGRRPHRRGRDQDRRHPVFVHRGAPGRELPQDAAGDGRRHPRHPRQARRSAAQHAHAAAHARGAARAHRPGDARHLRADRQPPGHERRSRTSSRSCRSSYLEPVSFESLQTRGRGQAPHHRRHASRS